MITNLRVLFLQHQEPNLLKVTEEASSVVRNDDCAAERFQPGAEISIELQVFPFVLHSLFGLP